MNCDDLGDGDVVVPGPGDGSVQGPLVRICVVKVPRGVADEWTPGTVVAAVLRLAAPTVEEPHRVLRREVPTWSDPVVSDWKHKLDMKWIAARDNGLIHGIYAWNNSEDRARP